MLLLPIHRVLESDHRLLLGTRTRWASGIAREASDAIAVFRPPTPSGWHSRPLKRRSVGLSPTSHHLYLDRDSRSSMFARNRLAYLILAGSGTCTDGTCTDGTCTGGTWIGLARRALTGAAHQRHHSNPNF